MRDEPKKAEISPALKKLAETPDPDVERKLSPEEIKATLAAAQGVPPPQPARVEIAGLKPAGEWQSLERDQKAHREAYRQRLMNGVYVAPGDDHYHNASCASLYGYALIGGVMERRYIGSMITLGTAKERGLRPHAACGAPSYEDHYQ